MNKIIENLRRSILGSWKETGENKSQFLQRKNLEEGVILELKMLDFTFSISFHFHFIFI